MQLELWLSPCLLALERDLKGDTNDQEMLRLPNNARNGQANTPSAAGPATKPNSTEQTLKPGSGQEALLPFSPLLQCL